MKIYLAGKISEHDWRETIVGWRFEGGRETDGTFGEIPLIFEGPRYQTHRVTGPFFLYDNHAPAYGDDTHGMAANSGGYNETPRAEVVALCLDAILRATVVFAWLDESDAHTAHGTIYELGYAKALGTPVWIAGDEPIRDQWFAHTGADRCLWGAGGPADALKWYLDHSEMIPQTCDINLRSPIFDGEQAKARRLYAEFAPAGKRVQIPKHIRAAVWQKTGGHCWYCKNPTNPYDDFHVDHVIPVSRGGANRIDNLVPCCRTCNLSKGASAVASR